MGIRPERPVGLLERYSVARHNVGIYYNITVGLKYQPLTTWTSRETILDAFLCAAAVCLAEHPYLGTVLIDDDTNKPQWGRLETVDLRQIVQFRDLDAAEGAWPSQFEALLQELQSTPFQTEDKTLPLWKLILVPGQNNAMFALLVVHHAGCDGLSALAFHDTLHRALNTPPRTIVAYDGPSLCSNDPLPPPLEKVRDVKPGFMCLFYTILTALILPTWLSAVLGLKYPFYIGPVKTEIRTSKTGIHRLTLEPAVMDDLVRLARAKSVTITAVLYAALGAAMTSTFVGQPPVLTGSVAVSQRPQTKPLTPPAEMLNYAAGFTHVLPPSFNIRRNEPYNPTIGEIVDFAQVLTKRMKHPTMRADCLKGVGLLGYLPSRERSPNSHHRYDSGWEKFLRAEAKAGIRRASFGISNVGAWSPSTASTVWSIAEAHFSQSMGPIAELITVCAVTLRDGPMNLALQYEAGILDDDDLMILEGRFMATLLYLAGGQRIGGKFS